MLSNIITNLNEKFGTDFNDADRLFFDQIEEELYLDEELKNYAMSNSPEAFTFPFDEIFVDKIIDRMNDNEEIFKKNYEQFEFKKDVRDWLRDKVYERFHNESKENVVT